MKEYRSVQTCFYQFEAWLRGEQCGYNFTNIKRGEWAVDSVVKVPQTGWVIINFYRDIK